MKDIDAVEMNQRLWLYEKIREVVSRYGFQIVEPTTLENLKTLEAKSGPAVRKEIYWFKDKSGRSLGLRFDLTVGLARMIANRYDLPEPVKFATIGGNWRYDEPQFGRYRYFTQWDVEIFGSETPAADAEVISVGADILSSIGFKEFVIRTSNRRLTESYLKQLGIRSQKQLEQSLRIIDKIRKEPSDQVRKEFKAIRVKQDIVDRVLAFTSLNGPPSKVLNELSRYDFREDASRKGLSELSILADELESFGRITNCAYDLSIVRGIGYYDGIVFEAFDKGGEDIGSIFGGGRYDKLCRIYGKRDLAATGVAGGIERLMISLERANLFPKTRQGAKVFVASVQEDVRPEAIRLAQKLRSSGISVEVDLKGRSLSKQLEYANSAQIPYVIVLGQKEIQTQAVRIKSMATRTEIEASLSDLPERLRSLD
jgi:histidyl-tRNA synthetase